MIFVIDFGGQTAHLITRRLKDLGVSSRLILPENAYKEITDEKPAGLIFSGGPSSVYERGAPSIDKKVLLLNMPMLDICYGLQLRSHLLGGKVVSGTKEYGPVKLTLEKKASPLTKGLPTSFTVWMSHGDSVLSMPKEFQILGSSDTVEYAFVADEKNHRYGLQFHPEIEHTQYGNVILNNFIAICGITQKKYELNPDEMIEKIRSAVGNSYVIGAVSGGLDSTVAGVLTAQAVGNHFIPIFVDNGLMREGAEISVTNSFARFGIKPIIVREEHEMIKRLIGKADGEEKRKIIGNFYVELFEREMQKQLKKGRDVRFLLQGTIFSDVIESKGSKYASKIKSHHNVGGLPTYMKLQLLEPMRELYTDQVRMLAKKLGIADDVIYQQPHPGPGFAIRILGEVTKERLSIVKKADEIVVEELKKTNWYEKLIHSFAVLTDSKSTAVKGDGRHFGEVIALRAITSQDRMTADWAKLPYDLLQKISSRIVNEVPDVSRVVYDITTKPPATMEWE